MTCTWLICALYLWDSIFFGHRFTFFQSKKETDANENVKRAFFIWRNLPIFMKEFAPVSDKFCRLDFTRNESVIIGIPAGPDHARQYTSSGFFSDEIAFQPDVDLLMAAVSPTLAGGGRFTAVSSAAASYFSMMVRDLV